MVNIVILVEKLHHFGKITKGSSDVLHFSASKNKNELGK